MHILIAPNAFKHSVSGADAARAIQEGLMQSRLDCTCECFPVGDGGDGTGDLIIKKFGGIYLHAPVSDALGRRINASFGLIDEERTAVIEMANASGIRLLQSHELDPLHASSFGTGQQIKMALDRGVDKIIIAMGGSATVDGACGMLQALGVRFLDAKGRDLEGLPETLTELNEVDLSRLHKRATQTEVIVLCDVDNKLLGENGSAAVFGPQKGASAKDVKKLDDALANYSRVVFRQTGHDIENLIYGGTAGGAAAGLYAFLNARLVHGIEYFLEITGFDNSLRRTDLVITGEGSIDEQTLQGKAPFGVARKAKEKGLPVIALGGRVPLEKSIVIQQYFDIILPIGNEPSDLATALQRATDNLKRTSREIGDLLNMVINKSADITSYRKS